MLFGLPTALVSSGFGAITGFAGKIWSQNQEVKASERKHQMDMMVAVTKANSDAADTEIKLMEAKIKYEKGLSKTDPHRSVARRVLAYGLLITLAFGIPYMVVMYDFQWFDIKTVMEESNGIFGIGKSNKEIQEVTTVIGLPMIWLMTLLDVFAGIISFYFGGSIAKFRNPYAK